MRVFITGLFTLALSACAGTGSNSSISETEALAQACQARGGILQPSGQLTGQPAADNACVIRGAPTTIQREQ